MTPSAEIKRATAVNLLDGQHYMSEWSSRHGHLTAGWVLLRDVPRTPNPLRESCGHMGNEQLLILEKIFFHLCQISPLSTAPCLLSTFSVRAPRRFSKGFFFLIIKKKERKLSWVKPCFIAAERLAKPAPYCNKS